MTELLIIETGEVIQLMTAEEASSVTTRIAVKLDAIGDNYEAVMPLIRDAITRQAHAALGYRSPGEYVADRFGSALSRLGAEMRRGVVQELSAAGLSTRAIAPVVGVSQMTAVRDISAGETYVSPPNLEERMNRNPDYGDDRLPVRFWTKVYPEPNTGCWLWGNSIDGCGYGLFGVRASRHRRAHLVAYETLVQPIPPGLQIDHLCRVRWCCFPGHLEPVTGPENARRGLWGVLRIQCKRGHQVIPFSGRCQECRRLHNLSINRPGRQRARQTKGASS